MCICTGSKTFQSCYADTLWIQEEFFCYSTSKARLILPVETALDALNKKIPKLEEKINQDKQLLEELKAKRETLEVEALKKFLHDNGMTTEEIIAKLTAASSVVHEQKIVMEDRKNVEH